MGIDSEAIIVDYIRNYTKDLPEDEKLTGAMIAVLSLWSQCESRCRKLGIPVDEKTTLGDMITGIIIKTNCIN